MKKILTLAITACLLSTTVQPIIAKTNTVLYSGSTISIKLKNDGDDEITVINAGSGGTYRLQKNIVTTIKMEEGDKLYIYEKGKKGALLLVASSEMDGKVQLLSKL